MTSDRIDVTWLDCGAGLKAGPDWQRPAPEVLATRMLDEGGVAL
jgi:hypothetical protein